MRRHWRSGYVKITSGTVATEKASGFGRTRPIVKISRDPAYVFLTRAEESNSRPQNPGATGHLHEILKVVIRTFHPIRKGIEFRARFAEKGRES
jgi:hypothetical protein